jgi:NADH:ubiquinone oxidoreductase subunit
VSADPRPCVVVAVVMERDTSPNRWEDWRHRLVEVVPHEAAFGSAPRLLADDGRVARWLHPNLRVELFRDEGEGYYLNLTSGAPVWFVMWRIDDQDPARAWPEIVSLSYNEAGRWLDAQERVDNVPLPPEMAAWLREYTDAHYKPEPKERKRPASFKAPGERR